jgi:hypothetical protein
VRIILIGFACFLLGVLAERYVNRQKPPSIPTLYIGPETDVRAAAAALDTLGGGTIQFAPGTYCHGLPPTHTTTIFRGAPGFKSQFVLDDSASATDGRDAPTR